MYFGIWGSRWHDETSSNNRPYIILDIIFIGQLLVHTLLWENFKCCDLVIFSQRRESPDIDRGWQIRRSNSSTNDHGGIIPQRRWSNLAAGWRWSCTYLRWQPCPHCHRPPGSNALHACACKNSTNIYSQHNTAHSWVPKRWKKKRVEKLRLYVALHLR